MKSNTFRYFGRAIHASRIQHHPFQGLARHLQQGGAEKPGNPIIPAGALQLGGQEILQWTTAGGVAMDHTLSPFQKSDGGNCLYHKV